MVDSTVVALPDLDSLRSRVEQLKEIHRNSEEVPQISPSEAQKLFRECANEVEAKINEILSATLDVNFESLEDFDDFVNHLKKELSSLEDENSKAESEMQELSTKCVQDNGKLESELEGLSCSLDFLLSQGTGNEKVHANVDLSTCDKVEENSSNPDRGSELKIMELNHPIENTESTLKALEALHDQFRRLNALERIQQAFSGVEVVEFEGNSIRLSLRTYIPSIDSILSQQRKEDNNEPLEQNHELLIELIDGTMEIQKAEILPNDVYINDIVDMAKSLRTLFSPVLETRSSLEWLMRRVQDQIVLSTVRHSMVKRVNKFRYSLEYVDKEEMIIAHLMSGLDAFIKVANGWPIFNSPLYLTTLKSSSINSNDTSLGSVGEVVKLANSLEVHMRENLSSFVDRIEEILSRQMAAVKR